MINQLLILYVYFLNIVTDICKSFISTILLKMTLCIFARILNIYLKIYSATNSNELLLSVEKCLSYSRREWAFYIGTRSPQMA